MHVRKTSYKIGRIIILFFLAVMVLSFFIPLIRLMMEFQRNVYKDRLQLTFWERIISAGIFYPE